MTDDGRKYGPSTGREPSGRFAAGNPGRPRGARHRASLIIEALLEGEAEALTLRAVELALSGDTTALRLCLERLAPVRKGRPVTFDLPDDLGDTAGLRAATEALLRAVSEGQLAPEEASAIMPLVESLRRVVETEELEARIAELERKRR